MLADVFDKLQQQPRHSRWREEKDQDDGDEKNERQKRISDTGNRTPSFAVSNLKTRYVNRYTISDFLFCDFKVDSNEAVPRLGPTPYGARSDRDVDGRRQTRAHFAARQQIDTNQHERHQVGQ